MQSDPDIEYAQNPARPFAREFRAGGDLLILRFPDVTQHRFQQHIQEPDQQAENPDDFASGPQHVQIPRSKVNGV